MDNTGKTVLMYAIADRNPQSLQLILSCRVDVNAQNYRGETALFQACKLNNIVAVRELLAYRAEANRGNEQLITPLMVSLSKNKLDIVEILLRHGADPTLTDIGMKNAFEYASTEEARNLLSRYCAFIPSTTEA
jgi:ankyrin repeat protein